MCFENGNRLAFIYRKRTKKMRKTKLLFIVLLLPFCAFSQQNEDFFEALKKSDINDIMHVVKESKKKHIQNNMENECKKKGYTDAYCKQRIEAELADYEEEQRCLSPILAQRLCATEHDSVFIDENSFVILLLDKKKNVVKYVVCYRDFFSIEAGGCLGCNKKLKYKILNAKRVLKKNPETIVFSDIWGLQASLIGYTEEGEIFINDLQKDCNLMDFMKTHKICNNENDNHDLIEYESKVNLLIPYIKTETK